MAGNWIKVSTFPDDMKMYTIAKLTDAPQDSVYCCCIRWFGYVDFHCDSSETGLTVDEFNRITRWGSVKRKRPRRPDRIELLEAMQDPRIRYIEMSADCKTGANCAQNECITVAKMELHFGKSARMRAQSSRQKRVLRASSADKTSARLPDSVSSFLLPRVEKSREEKKKATPPSPPKGGLPPFSGCDLPEKLDTPKFRAAWTDFCQHRVNIKTKLTKLAVTKLFNICEKIREENGLDATIERIDYTVASGKYPSIYPSGNSRSVAQTRDASEASGRVRSGTGKWDNIGKRIDGHNG